MHHPSKGNVDNIYLKKIVLHDLWPSLKRNVLKFSRHRNIQKFSQIVTPIIAKNVLANKLLFQVEYDPTSIDVTHGVQFKVVYITYNINGQSRRYRPASPLRLTDLPTMAEGVSMEIYESYV